MKKTLSCLAVSSLLSVVACVRPGASAPMEAHVTPVAPTSSAEPIPPPDAPRDVEARFPAGPGVTLLADQFQVVIRDPRVRDRKASFDERVALAEQVLGKGAAYHEPPFDGFVWYGLGGRTTNAPFGCQELVLSSTSAPWMLRPTDHRNCGLPYVPDATKPWSGPAPKRSAFRLEEILAEAGAKTPSAAVGWALMKLGAADAHGENGEETWTGLGPRGKDAPITCKRLHLGGRPRIEDAPLSECHLAWPMPGMTFDPGPAVAPLDKSAKLAECSSRCGANELCMIDQRVPYPATMRREPDGERARFPDGRAAKAELVASCLPVPSTCSTANASCFFPTPVPGQPMAPPSNGPCPRETYGGRSFQTMPRSHIVCYSRIGGPPLLPPPTTIAPPAPVTKPLAPRVTNGGSARSTSIDGIFRGSRLAPLP